MNASLKTIDRSGDIAAMMRSMGAQARAAARRLALAAPAEKDRALEAMARSVCRAVPAILAANSEDLAEARKAGATVAYLDRLGLDEKRVDAMGGEHFRELGRSLSIRTLLHGTKYNLFALADRPMAGHRFLVPLI